MVETKEIAVVKPLDEEMDEIIKEAGCTKIGKSWSDYTKIANTAIRLSNMILNNPEVGKVVKAMQGSPLGFKTDKDKSGGYSLTELSKIVPAAFFYGASLTGNEFNIISDRFYPTVELFTKLVMNVPGLKIGIETCNIVSVNGSETLVNGKIEYVMNNIPDVFEHAYSVKNSSMFMDGLTSKWRRRAYRDLLKLVAQIDVPEGTDGVMVHAETPDQSSTKALLDNMRATEPQPEPEKTDEEKRIEKLKQSHEHFSKQIAAAISQADIDIIRSTLATKCAGYPPEFKASIENMINEKSRSFEQDETIPLPTLEFDPPFESQKMDGFVSLEDVARAKRAIKEATNQIALTTIQQNIFSEITRYKKSDIDAIKQMVIDKTNSFADKNAIPYSKKLDVSDVPH